MKRRRAIIPPAGVVAGFVLALAVILVPLAHGGATPFGTLVVRLAALGVFLTCLSAKGPEDWGRELRASLIALALIAGLGLSQSVSWPRDLVVTLSPMHVQLADEAAVTLGADLPAFVAPSVMPSASRRVALDTLVFGLLAIAAFHIGRRRRGRRWLAVAVVGAACIQIALGLRPLLAGWEPRLRGSYVNPNHLALLLELAACVALASLCWTVMTRRWADDSNRRVMAISVAGVMLVLLIVGIVLTGSRTGLVAVAAGFLVLAALLVKKNRGVVLLLFGGVALAVTGFLAWVGMGGLLGRHVATSWFELAGGARSVVWRSSLDLVREFPFFGSGLGTFEAVFPLVQPSSLEGTRWVKAHNDLLEFLITAGLVGAVLALVGTVSLIRGLLERHRFGRLSQDRLGAGAALACLTAVAVHELFDFGLSLPANAFVLITVLASAMGSTRSPSKQGRSLPVARASRVPGGSATSGNRPS